LYLVRLEAIAFRADLYFAGIYFLFFPREIFELHWPIATKFCTVIGSVFNFLILVHNFGAFPPKKFWGQKHAKFGPISDNFEVARHTANISGTDKDIQCNIVMLIF